MIIPRETSQFGFYDIDGKTVKNMTDTDEYKNNFLGIKDLHL